MLISPGHERMASSPEFIRLATSSSRALADTALDSLREAVVIVDARHPHFPVVLANAAARRSLIYDSDIFGLIESSLFQWMTPDSSAFVAASLIDPSEHSSPIRRILEWRAAAGEMSVMTDVMLLMSTPGQRLIMLTFAPGIEEPDHRLLALTEHARDIMTVATADEKLQYVSGGVKNSLGYTSEERESSYLFEHVHPEDCEVLRTNYRQLVAGNINSYSCEFRVRHKDGSYRWLESSFSSALDNPLIGGVVINSRDITERKMAESRLAQREELYPTGGRRRGRHHLRMGCDAGLRASLARGAGGAGHGARRLGTDHRGLACADPSAGFRGREESGEPRRCSRAGAGRRRIEFCDAGAATAPFLERGLIQRNVGGDPVRAVGCCVDVSEIKRLTDLLAETQRSAKMGGWEYSYATRELTWTEEMYRIYETAPDGVRGVLGLHAGAVRAGVAAAHSSDAARQMPGD